MVQDLAQRQPRRLPARAPSTGRPAAPPRKCTSGLSRLVIASPAMRTLVVLAAFLIACGPGSERSDGGNGSGSGSGSGSGNAQGCSDAAKLVYVVDSSNKFSKFDPSTKMFTDLGTLSCPGTGLLDQP